VIDILLARRERGSRAPHGDGARVALAIEGGAMRGVISAGMVSALEHLGLTHAFDAVFGSSAGAINGAYFLAGQAALGTGIYSEDINNRHFIDLVRPLGGRPIVDLGFLMTEVARKRKPLDVDGVLASTCPLIVMATDVVSASRASFRRFANAEALFLALRAGATMPVVAGPPVSVDGRAYLDASLTEPIPVPMAESDGFTHVLALLTRPAAAVPSGTGALDRYYVIPRLERLSPGLAMLYANRSGPYGALLDQIAHGRGPAGRAHVKGLQPTMPEVSKLEKDAARLRAAAQDGFDVVVRAFERSSDAVRPS
jgi:predicted patatin/cPLA2 family phospholipase